MQIRYYCTLSGDLSNKQGRQVSHESCRIVVGGNGNVGAQFEMQ